MGVSDAGTFHESVRAPAIGMVEGGYSQRQVGECPSLTRCTVNKWWRRFVEEQLLEDRPRSDRPSAVSRMAKIVWPKRQTREVRGLGSWQLDTLGRVNSYRGVLHRGIRGTHLRLKVTAGSNSRKSLKKKQKNEFELCQKLRNWTTKGFSRVIWILE